MFKRNTTGFILRIASLGFRLLVHYNGLEPIELCQGLLFLLIVLPTLHLMEVSATWCFCMRLVFNKLWGGPVADASLKGSVGNIPTFILSFTSPFNPLVTPSPFLPFKSTEVCAKCSYFNDNHYTSAVFTLSNDGGVRKTPFQTMKVCAKRPLKRRRCAKNTFPNGGGVQIWVLSC